jgi:preprotein translocase subunit SecG
MTTILLTIHIIIAVALVGTVLLQRNEGGGLGIGGPAGGGFMTARGTANLLTRTTAILAALFFATSIGLAIIAGAGSKPTSIVDEVLSTTPAPVTAPSGPAVPTGN